jgi:hypothetical protein
MAQKRIDFFGGFQPTGADPTAGAKYEALAGIGQTLQQGLTGIIQQQDAKQQQQQQKQQQERERRDVLQAQRDATRQSTDEQGRMIAPKLRDPATAAGRSFNEIVTGAYRADVRRQLKEADARLSQQHMNDPEAYQIAMDAFREGITNGLPPELKFPIDEDIKNTTTNTLTSLSTDMFNRERRAGLAAISASMEDMTTDMLNAAREGNTEAFDRNAAELLALEERGVEGGYLDPVAVNQQREQVAKQVERQKVVGGLERIAEYEDLLPEDRIAMMQEYIGEQTQDFSEDLSPDERDSIEAELNATLANEVNKAQTLTVQQGRNRAQQLHNLKMDAKYGQRPPQDVLNDAYTAFAKGEITGPQMTQIETTIRDNEVKRFEQGQRHAAVFARMGGESVMIEQKDVDSTYEAYIAPMIADMEPAQAIAEIANFSIATGIVPKQAKQIIANGIYSENPDAILAAVEMFDRISEVPGLDVGLSKEQEVFADVAAGLLTVTTPEEALRLAREQTDPSNKPRNEYRMQQLKDKGIDYVDAVEDVFDKFWGGVPDLDDKNRYDMADEYEDLVTSYYLLSGDLERAKQKAGSRMRKNWQHSKAFDRWMKYPADSYYNIGGDSSYIKPQLMDWAKENAPGVNIQDVMLISDKETGRMVTNGLAPDYLVVAVDNNGEMVNIYATDPETGRQGMQRYAPDITAGAEWVMQRNERLHQEREKKGREAEQRRVEQLQRIEGMPVDGMYQTPENVKQRQQAEQDKRAEQRRVEQKRRMQGIPADGLYPQADKG